MSNRSSSAAVPPASSPAARAVMRGNRRADRTPELRVRSILHRRGLRFRVDCPIDAGEVRVRADLLFSAIRVAIFIDGCFWHRCPVHGTAPVTNAEYWTKKLTDNVTRDQRVNRSLELAGWCVLRIWEHEPAEEAADRIVA